MDKHQEPDENTGWIKLHRKLLENPLIKEPRLLQVMAYCLLKANHKETKMLWNGQEIILKPGQFITGRTQANNDLGLKSIMFDRKLKILQNRGFLNREVNNRFSIITITNWEKYQNRQEEVNSQMNNKRTTDEQQMNTNKNDKNVKNEKETTTTTTSPDVAAVISQIFKGQVKTDKVKDQIKGKNPDEVMALAHYCQEQSNARNPVGLFFTMLKEGTRPPAPAAKTRPDIPPPRGGYQSGTDPLDSPRPFVPEEVIVLFQQYGDSEHIVDNKLWKFLDRYHEKHKPREYHKDKDQLTPEEIANMLAMAGEKV